MILSNEFYSMLGFAVKAGACCFGATACEKKARSGSAKLIILDAGLSPASKKEFIDLCGYYRLPCLEAEPIGKLGQACGRAHNKIVGVVQEGFSSRLQILARL